MFVFSRFRTNLLSSNHSTIQERTKFHTEDKSSKCLLILVIHSNNLLIIMTLVSYANIIYSDKEFILFWKAIYVNHAQ